MITNHSRLSAISTCLLLAFTGHAGAQTTSGVHLELNKAEQIDGACRMYLVIENRTSSTFRNLQLDLVGFDPDGIIAQRILLETAPLPAHKTRLKVFDMGSECQAVGRILINEVLLCETGDDKTPDCGGMLSASSRTAIELVP
ncbi:MAG: hypothetical protein R3E83_08605 [Burkholderiaceae bacterium]